MHVSLRPAPLPKHIEYCAIGVSRSIHGDHSTGMQHADSKYALGVPVCTCNGVGNGGELSTMMATRAHSLSRLALFKAATWTE